MRLWRDLNDEQKSGDVSFQTGTCAIPSQDDAQIAEDQCPRLTRLLRKTAMFELYLQRALKLRGGFEANLDFSRILFLYKKSSVD